MGLTQIYTLGDELGFELNDGTIVSLFAFYLSRIRAFPDTERARRRLLRNRRKLSRN